MRLAIRHLVRRPSTSLVAILALGTGIGAATSLFTLVDRVLVRPLPYAGADRIAQVWTTFPHWRGEPALDALWDRIALSWEDLDAVRSKARSIDGAGAAYFRAAQAAAGGETEVRTVARGSSSLLDLLGVRTAHGRWFAPDEEGPGAPRVVVASWDYWATRLGGDPAAIGRDVRIEGDAFRLIGVLPRTFRFPPVMPVTETLGEAALWQPIGISPGDFTANSNNYETVVRLKSGVTLATAEAEILSLTRGDRPPERRGARLVPRLDAVTVRARTPLLLLLAATGTLLLIACGNVALLLLGSAHARTDELRLKSALGASRARLTREQLVESALLALAGGTLGTLLAFAAVRALPALLPAELPRADEITMDLRILGFAVLVSLASGTLAGLLPSLLSARGASNPGGARSTRRGAAGVAVGVMAAQIALSTVLMVATLLFSRSLGRQLAVDPGVRTDGLLAVTVDLPRWKHDAASSAALYERALESLAALPGVRGASITTRVPLSGEGGSWAVAALPDTVLGVTSPAAYHEAVAPSFFSLLGVPIEEGRGFTTADGPGAARVAVVNRTMAERLWPGVSPIGRAFRAPNGGQRTVIGMAADVRHHGLERPAEASFYEPIAQLPSRPAVILLRTDDDLAVGLMRSIATVLRGLDPDMPAAPVRALSEVLRSTTADERFGAVLVAAFGWIATLLAAIGLAGVTFRVVSARRRELGVRLALGATTKDVIGTVARGGILALGIGLMVGLPAALAVARLFASQLFEIGPADPTSITSAAALLVLVAAVALAAPAARALRTEASEVLRSE